MDGKRKDCPIVPAESIRVNLNEDEEDYIIVSATHDTIQSFSENKYDYLRYYDADTGELKAFWFPADLLADLYDAGIPLTKRESITILEYQLYCKQVGRLGLEDVVDVEEIEEPLALMPGDPIDAEVQKAHEHIDAELSYYLKEWLE